MYIVYAIALIRYPSVSHVTSLSHVTSISHVTSTSHVGVEILIYSFKKYLESKKNYIFRNFVKRSYKNIYIFKCCIYFF